MISLLSRDHMSIRDKAAKYSKDYWASNKDNSIGYVEHVVGNL